FVLFSFGGTAGMHVGAYGEALGVPHVVVPHSASVHGAFGLVASDIAHEDQIIQPLRAPFDTGAVRSVFAELESRILDQLRVEGFAQDDIRLHRSIDMRYRRQVHILTCAVRRTANSAKQRSSCVAATSWCGRATCGAPSTSRSQATASRRSRPRAASSRPGSRCSTRATCSGCRGSSTLIPTRRRT